MSIEGGAFECFKHDFKTNNVQEWDEHCYENEHTLTVKCCPDCGCTQDKKISYPKNFVEKSHQGKEVFQLKCEDCSA